LAILNEAGGGLTFDDRSKHCALPNRPALCLASFQKWQLTSSKNRLILRRIPDKLRRSDPARLCQIEHKSAPAVSRPAPQVEGSGNTAMPIGPFNPDQRGVNLRPGGGVVFANLVAVNVRDEEISLEYCDALRMIQP
jgi:hypothetical protein